jgi:hypothetical protein
VFAYFANVPTYTQVLARGFTGYEIIEEERDNTLITLNSDLRVFAERGDGEGGVVVSQGTVGRLLSRGDGVPTVMWEWPFNGWALLGRILESILTSGLRNVLNSTETTALVLAVFRVLSGVMSADVEAVVSSTSEEMAQEWDVISVTYELVSQALESLDLGGLSQVDVESFLAVAEEGFKVLEKAVLGREGSIWGLIVKGGSKFWGRLSRIGISVEMSSQTQCMPVTMAAIGLVDALFRASVASAVLSDGFSMHLRREVLWIASGYVLDVWIGFNEWKYIIAERRFEIGIPPSAATVLQFCLLRS